MHNTSRPVRADGVSNEHLFPRSNTDSDHTTAPATPPMEDPPLLHHLRSSPQNHLMPLLPCPLPLPWKTRLLLFHLPSNPPNDLMPLPLFPLPLLLSTQCLLALRNTCLWWRLIHPDAIVTEEKQMVAL